LSPHLIWSTSHHHIILFIHISVRISRIPLLYI
jgi:hypothetical protein